MTALRYTKKNRISLLLSCPLTNDDEGRPEQGMGIIVVEAYVRALGLLRINSGAQSRSQNALRFAQRVLSEPCG